MRGLLLGLLALSACRQALGIPSGGSVEGEDIGFRVVAQVSGAIGARGGAMVLVNGDPVTLTDGEVRLERPLVDGESYTVEPVDEEICRVANGSGTIDGEDATGVVIECNGLSALGSFGFSAPITFEPSFDPSLDTTAALASLIVQQTSLVPAPLHPTATIMRVEFGGAPATPTSGMYGPIPIIEGRAIGVALQGSSFSRMHLADPTLATPAVFGYGKPAAAEESAWFGQAVAASGNVLVVGAPNRGPGHAYVYRRSGAAWAEDGELVATGLQDGDRFGASVAVLGDAILVGAPGDATRAGAAYPFTKTASGWTAGAKLSAPVPANGDEFGAAVALTPTVKIVGAPGVGPGAVHEISSNPLTFTPSGRNGDRVGASLAVYGTRVVVGAPGDDSAFPGNRTNTDFADAGAVYVRTIGDANVIVGSGQYIKAAQPGAGDRFGTSVAIDDNILVVGAPLEDSSATGLDGDADDNSFSGAGAVYLFDLSNRLPAMYLKAPNTNTGDNFGRAVAIRFNTVGTSKSMVLAVSAPFEDSGNASMMSDESAADSGAIYAYAFAYPAADPTFAGEAVYIKASAIEAGDHVGASLALTNEMLVAGAPLEDSSTTGWNQPPNEDLLDAGAVLSFR